LFIFTYRLVQTSKTQKMETTLKLTPISVDEMLVRPEQEYNPRIWKERVTDYTKYAKCQFYVIESDGKIYSYARFYVSYVYGGENLYFFSDFSAFSSSLTNNGFCKVMIDETGLVHKFLFTDPNGKEGYARNCKENRQMFAKNLTPINVMVSNCI